MAGAGSAEIPLRRALLAGASLIAAGTVAELVLAEHYEEPVQRLPFAVCAALLGAVGVAGWRTGPRSLWSLRVAAVVAVLAGGFGVFEHGEHNYAFEAEIRPAASTSELWVEALYGGSPLLAPGMIAVAGLLAFAATWRHPGLRR